MSKEEISYATLCKMWSPFKDICPLTWITNAQNFTYWADKAMYKALEEQDDEALQRQKHACKSELFETVADQNGEIFHEDVVPNRARWIGAIAANVRIRSIAGPEDGRLRKAGTGRGLECGSTPGLYQTMHGWRAGPRPQGHEPAGKKGSLRKTGASG